jgi:hypothetical protein
VNRYVVGGYTPVWDLESNDSLSRSSEVKIDFIEVEKQAIEREGKGSKETSGVIWLIVIVILGILYFLL